MGQINRHVDMTGSMEKEDIHTAEISTIVDELNRASDNIDSLLNNLAIAAYGTLSYIWDGTPYVTPVRQSIALTSSGALFPIVFMKRSDLPNQLYSLPYGITLANANGDAVLASYFQAGTDLSTNSFFVEQSFFATGTPKTYTYYYYLISQPPTVSSN